NSPVLARNERVASRRAILTRPEWTVRSPGLATRQVLLDQATVSALGALTSSGRFALATSTRALNAAGSLTARSARILRSTSTSAAFRPWMKRLYVMPWARAAALIRWIHRRRKSPFLALRSLYE